jgi:ADP-ribose pyrophosphatase YjhB (NUDIX family)
MNFCSHCAKPVQQVIPPNDDRIRFVCQACGRVHYENPKLVVGCIPVWENRLLLCLRNIEPRKGMWTLPAGFLENGETVKDGARRETFEETGASVQTLHPYLMFDIVHVHQIYLMFRTRLTAPRFHKTPESAAVRLFSEKEIPWDDIAFPVIQKTLACYFDDRTRNAYPFQIRRIDQKLSSV